MGSQSSGKPPCTLQSAETEGPAKVPRGLAGRGWAGDGLGHLAALNSLVPLYLFRTLEISPKNLFEKRGL